MTLISNKYWVLSLLLLLGSVIPSDAAAKTVNSQVLHIINRLSFGPAPGDIKKVESMGVQGYIRQQLSPDSISEPESLTRQLSQMKTLNLNPMQRLQYAANISAVITSGQEKKPASMKQSGQIVQETIQSRLLRATSSNRQLQEVMVDFWYNHFNVDAAKGRNRIWVGAYEQEAIRPHVLGRFRDLLGATARHPAMLLYLDNAKNKVSNRPDAKGKIGGLNENYARELMELHTLGVDGGYTQQDVIALARILSGWGIVNNPNQDNSDGFEFNSKHHDFSDKVFLGYKIKGSGKAEGEEALDILARSPATARHISYKLAQYFVNDNPPETLVKKLAQRYLATDGNIREVLNTLFQSSEFWDEKNFNSKFKTPYQYAISVVRATGMELKNTRPIQELFGQLAMPLYQCPTPDGYKNTKEAWLNPDAMTRRLSFATAIANDSLQISSLPPQKNPNKVKAPKPRKTIPSVGDAKLSIFKPRRQMKPGKVKASQARKATKSIPVDYEQLMNTLGNSFSPQTQKAIASSPPEIRSGLILGSPEFMQR
ncbi:DUF1800 domain-containing protein [Anabaena cylindrica FACHB-243]|uniref:DUF1800 domain-containing protein n=1 Tax=Anabaena TaxID=1163 RepID=UPI000B5E63CC|nr:MULTISPECIES: DUF1800 domain-containing protein [Anabaena]BAY05652.1 hypothetical protein NIES19_49270 [Anabaena cylindrica PCC 7122]MBD2421039.1 DUF1800 domain-containing protein [Anabaena cylindrica FACHB-243]MBY5280743.1 DUF1800 domain-containing protein [Anabaena sp. CCAP 1446/1C]MBY5306390.1 DUF1800 domain-containing protein [Anabaena sp. CCAP 1446/1C]MCM2405791.1 DUF1800 domain-containing protein [Anabaena sp. CCAP 1446/1C]